MKHELSILIPVYNDDCTRLAAELSRQASLIEGLSYEVIVSDDCSPNRGAVAGNAAIDALPYCRYIVQQVNVGSAANRNLLARESLYEWLLYIDCDVEVLSDDFLQRYLQADDADVTMGGIAIGGDPEALATNLRYRYEQHCAPAHSAANRSKRPYQSFRSCNFLVRRSVMLACPFDERFKKSGYEDVCLGCQLKNQSFAISHIDNPVTMTSYESNADYINKVERSLRTLYQFHSELRGYSRLLTAAEGIHLSVVRWGVALLFRLTSPVTRRLLCSSRKVSLRLFDAYRLGYYISYSLKKHTTQ